jgi:hypothetical protein
MRAFMKKPRRSFDWEDGEHSSENRLFDKDDLQDDVIELNEIVDLQDDLLDEEQTEDGEIEVLDADEDMDLGALDSFGHNDDLDDDFLKNLSFSKESQPVTDMSHFVADGNLDGSSEPLPGHKAKSVESQVLGKKSVVEQANDGHPPEIGDPQDFPSLLLDTFVEKIELKLLDAVREMVDAKLPEIVRSALKQEIERLLKEPKE